MAPSLTPLIMSLYNRQHPITASPPHRQSAYKSNITTQQCGSPHHGTIANQWPTPGPWAATALLHNSLWASPPEAIRACQSMPNRANTNYALTPPSSPTWLSTMLGCIELHGE